MKKMKKMVAFIIAMVMVLAMNITAMAASIQINPGENAEGTVSTNYTYYELLHASINGDAIAYYLNYTTEDTLKNLLDAVSVNGNDLFTFTKSADNTRWIATINKKAGGSEFTDTDGEDIAEALSTDAIKNAALESGQFSQETVGGEVYAKADNLEAGYYLITSTLGSKLVLQTLKDITITTKNGYITNDKTASETNMNVGDKVTYTITVNIPATAIIGDVVTVHDTLDTEKLAILNEEDTIAASADDYYITAKVGTNGSAVVLHDGTKKDAGETFAKEFAITADIIAAGKVTLSYDAELLSTALDDNGYVNDVFSNTSAYETEHSKVRVWTFDFDLDKNFQNVTGDDAANYVATFKLTDSEGNVIEFVQDETGYVKADSNDEGASPILTVNGKTNINIRGLKAGTYTLTETTTAAGYNLLTEAIAVTITDTTPAEAVKDETIPVSHTVTYKIGNGSDTQGTVTVENNTGTLLPSTGGIGTTIFYVLGAILVLAAGVILVTRKRMSMND